MRTPHNTREPSNKLYRALTRLMSGPIVDRRRQNYHRERRKNLSKYNFKSASGKQFKKDNYSTHNLMSSRMLLNQGRIERYSDFDEMMFEPIIAMALIIYATEVTTFSSIEELLKIKCPNEEIKVVLEELFYNILNIEHNLYSWVKTMCKYGDYFLYLDVDEEKGIQHVIGLPSNEVERLEGEDKTNPKYVQFQWNTNGSTFEDWQIAHFRILGDDKFAPYGESVLNPARRIFRQLELLENAMIGYRVVRATERRLVAVEVGGIPDDEIPQQIELISRSMKKGTVIDPNTGRADERYNPFSVEEDIFVPKRGDLRAADISILQSGQYVGAIDDVKYQKDKLFSALAIPQSYLFRGEGSSEDKSTLSQKDIMFGRIIQRIQLAVISELEKMAIIHLFTLGYTGEDLTSFKLSLNNPSKLAEMQDLETWRLKFEVAASATEGFFSRRWLAENIFDLSHKEFERMQMEIFYDRKFDARLEAMSQMAGSEAAGGKFGENLGDLADQGVDDIGKAEKDSELGAGTEDEDTDLLVAPGKRDEPPMQRRKERFTPGSKGHGYIPETDDGRSHSGRLKNMKSISGTGYTRPTQNNVRPGYKEMNSVGKGIQENVQQNEFTRINNEVKNIIKNLDKWKKNDK